MFLLLDLVLSRRRETPRRARRTQTEVGGCCVALLSLVLSAMSHAPMMSLDERERRAKDRGTTRPRQNMSARSDLSARSSDRSPNSPPTRGEGSLFDAYAMLQDPHRFSTDREEVEALMAMGVGYHELSEADERDLEAGWDPSPHKGAPAHLKHLKPVTREPWTIDMQIYNAKVGGDYDQPSRYGNGVDLFNMGQPAHDTIDDPRKRPKGARKAWDTQQFKPVPYSLRGLKPAATASDPWVRDKKRLEASGFENTNVIEDSTLTELDNGGEQRFKKGQFRAYKEERDRRLHKDAWDSSTRTW